MIEHHDLGVRPPPPECGALDQAGDDAEQRQRRRQPDACSPRARRETAPRRPGARRRQPAAIGFAWNHARAQSRRSGGGYDRAVGAEVLSPRALNRATLARQLLLERSPMPAREAIEHLVGMQARVPHNPYLGLWSRLAGFAPDELSQLLLERAVVRIVVMRATIHLVSADDCLLLRPLMQPVLEAELRRHRRTDRPARASTSTPSWPMRAASGVRRARSARRRRSPGWDARWSPSPRSTRSSCATCAPSARDRRRHRELVATDRDARRRRSARATPADVSRRARSRAARPARRSAAGSRDAGRAALCRSTTTRCSRTPTARASSRPNCAGSSAPRGARSTGRCSSTAPSARPGGASERPAPTSASSR